MATTKLKNKVVVVRNKLGTPIALELNGEKVPYVHNVNLEFGVSKVPKVTIELFSQDIEFRDVDTLDLKEPNKGPLNG